MFGNKPRRAEEHIPQDILRAARNAGLDSPLWYAGRRAATPEERAELEAKMSSIDEVVENAYREKGLEPPPRLTEEEHRERLNRPQS